MTIIEANQAMMAALRYRHREDIVAAEVAAGRSGRRFDFVAIACSWSKPALIGYEVKAQRSDFLRDDKWPAYLKSCKQLVFVTAPGVVKDIGEIPELCGWQELSKNGARLLTRKKAPVRVIEADDEARLFKLLLMRERGHGEDPTDFWKRWLTKRREDRELGRVLRYEIAATVAAKQAKLEREQATLARRCEALEAAEAMLQSLGVDVPHLMRVGTWNLKATLRKRIEAQEAGKLAKQADSVALAAQEAEQALQKLRTYVARFHQSVGDEMAEQDATPPA